MEDLPDYKAELNAMMAIGDALAALPLSASRARVLRWALAHFAPTIPAAANASATDRGPTRGPQAPLDVDPFEALADAAQQNTARVLAMRPRDAEEACEAIEPVDAAPGYDLVEACEAIDAPKIAVRAVKADGGVFEDFVAEFQRVARDWASDGDSLETAITARPLATAR